MDVPKVEVMTSDQARIRFQELGLSTVAIVNMKFSGPFAGVSSLTFTESSADDFVSILGSNFPASEGIEEIRAGVLMEVGNIVLNNVMGSLGNVLQKRFEFGTPEFFEGSINEVLADYPDETSAILLSLCNFTVESSATTGHITLIFDIQSLQSLLEAIYVLLS